MVLQFFEKSFLFPENLIFKLKYWKCSKFSLIVTQKHVNLSNRGLFWKSLVLSKPMLFQLALKWNLKEKLFSSVKTKYNSNFAVKLAERNNHSFLQFIIFFKHMYPLICKNMKTSEAAKQPFLYWIESKTIFPCVIKGVGVFERIH